MLGARLMALAVFELFADPMRHAAQDLEGRRRRLLVEKAAGPFRDLIVGIGILRRDVLDEIGKLLVVIDEGVEKSGIVRRQREFLDRIVLDGDVPVEGQRFRPLVEIGDRDRVAEHVVNPVQRHRLGRDFEPGGEHAQIVPVARTQHDPVFAERHGAVVAIFGLVMNREQRHRQSIMVSLGGSIYSNSARFLG